MLVRTAAPGGPKAGRRAEVDENLNTTEWRSQSCQSCWARATRIEVSVKRDGAERELDIDELTDDELHDLLKRSTPTQVRAYAFLLATFIRDKTATRASSPIKKKR